VTGPPPEDLAPTRGCLAGVGLGLLFWMIAVAAIWCAATGCLQ
jgi:hypothetical protein